MVKFYIYICSTFFIWRHRHYLRPYGVEYLGDEE